MRRGWEAEFKNGKTINEKKMEWKDLPKADIVRLTLRYDGREWNLHDKDVYTQKKRASTVPGMQDTFRIESRSIGYYDRIDDKNCKVWYTVNEFTGKMTMEVENL